MIDFISSHFWNIATAAFIFLPLERLLPRNRTQGIFRQKWSMDLVYTVLGGIISTAGTIVTIIAGVFCFSHMVPEGVKTFIVSQNLILQVIAIAFIADLWYYYAHRLFHRMPALWKFHAIHHSIEDMDWLAAHRVHPVDQILTTGVSLMIPIVLGFSTPAFAAYGILRRWHSLLKHSNVNFGFGWLNKIFVSPTFHHWHHANQIEAHDKNFAGMFSVIDRAFGTAIDNEEKGPDVYGVDDPLPNSFSAQMIAPFKGAQ